MMPRTFTAGSFGEVCFQRLASKLNIYVAGLFSQPPMLTNICTCRLTGEGTDSKLNHIFLVWVFFFFFQACQNTAWLKTSLAWTRVKQDIICIADAFQAPLLYSKCCKFLHSAPHWSEIKE